MADDLKKVIEQSKELNNIGFTEFTTNLVLKVFDGLVAANLSQTEAFLTLVQAVSKSLTDYINNTKDQIDGAQILQFLAALNPELVADPPKAISALTAPELATINSALAIPDSTANQVTTSSLREDLFSAIAKRLAANKYDLLKEMVKQGTLQLVVDRAIVETKLTFSTSVSTYFQSNSSSYNSSQFNFAATAKTGSALSRWVSASASANYATVSVQTANQFQQGASQSQVNIFGFVHIEFRTNFLPLTS